MIIACEPDGEPFELDLETSPNIDNLNIEFPIGFCLTCHKEVVAYTKIGSRKNDLVNVNIEYISQQTSNTLDENQLLHFCLFCNNEILNEGRALEYHTLSNIKERGFSILDYNPNLDEEPSKNSKKKCSSGGCCSKKKKS